MEQLSPALTPERPSHWVVLGGLTTTALALAGARWLSMNTDDFHVMGWYANYVLPVGPMLVGFVAGSGYALASWLSGVKITRRLLLGVVALLLGAYTTARWLDFRALDLHYESGRAVTFLEFIDMSARSFRWVDHGRPGEPLAAWGYGILLLEVTGFVFGGLALVAILRRQPFCEACQLYLRGTSLGLLPAGVAPRKVKRGDTAGTAALDGERAEALARGQALLQEIVAAGATGDADAVKRLLEPHRASQKAYGRLERRLRLGLHSCRGCRRGYLEASTLEGRGNRMRTVPAGRWDVPAALVTGFARG